MVSLQQQIADKFLTKLMESEKVDADKIEQLRRLLSASKKAKADDFVRIFSEPVVGDLT